MNSLQDVYSPTEEISASPSHVPHDESGQPRDRVDLPEPRHHLLIAGTGRAGTSALVRYLTALGLETHLSKRGDAADWNESANAGFEDLPFATPPAELPYVVKSPWSHQFVDSVLADPTVQLDAVIVPVRDLIEASASRTIVELQALHQGADWMTRMSTWEQWGTTAGGAVFSLNVVDQARLLAVGFHRLLEHLVKADVPTVFLAFPRLTTDPDYLFRKLSPLLPADTSIERAREAHAATFTATMVRVESELSREIALPPALENLEGPTLGDLDNVALKRTLELLRVQLKTHIDQTEQVETWRTTLERERDMLRDQLEHQTAHAAEAAAGRTALEHERDLLSDQLERQRAQAAEAEARCAALEQERALQFVEIRRKIGQALTGAERVREEKAQLQREIQALRDSTCWRITRPLRSLKRVFGTVSRSRVSDT